VWFSTANNAVVEATIATAYLRNSGGYDYTIVIFENDLPLDITPMQVAQLPSPEYYAVRFQPCQHNYLSANVGPFSSIDISIPAFNEHNTWLGGDSGSPDMLTTADAKLIFIGG
jgi:hypothetical protein